MLKYLNHLSSHTMSEQKKYIRVFDIESCNDKHKEGYTLHTVVTRISQEDMSGRIVTDLSYVMRLSSEKIYENITNLIDIPPNQVDAYLAKGWIVADSWSKLIRMVKKRESSDSGA